MGRIDSPGLRRRTFGILVLLALGCATGGTELTDDDTGDARDVLEATDDADAAPDAVDSGCPPGRTRCGGECVDLTTDAGHCGSCDRTCGPSEVCNEGVCASSCAGGLIFCAGGCVDPTSNADHCGVCGNACPDGLNADGVCELSVCILVCHAGWQDRDGAPGCEYACEPSGTAETCNGVDDDCDGETDEGFSCAVGRSTPCTTSCGTTGAGACTAACEPPAPAACTPPPEVCNGSDDDCDGIDDDGFPCSPGDTGSCATSCGSAGVRTCSAGCLWGSCDLPPETCNGFDDDCDGAADEDFACVAGAAGTCTTSCGSTGDRTCSASCAWGSCLAPEEVCNGRDDDCDGVADDGFFCAAGTTESCATSCGSSGSRVCSAGCSWGACTPPAETCNAVDDDCDGTTDDGFACIRGATGTCSTSCGSTGSRTCSASCSWSTCAVPAETCNGRDDDCDGTADEGFRTVVETTSYTVLSTFHPPCDGTTNRIGPDCNAAIHRYCWDPARGCGTSGFGPVETPGTPADIACVIAAAAADATFPALQAIHSGCDGVVQRAGPDCNAAISRWCSGRGYVSGFGPVENSYPSAWVVCVGSDTATYRTTTYTTLRGFHAPCDGTTQRWGLDCNAAIHRWCRSLGHVTGFGPVENSGDSASVVCLDG